MKIITCASYYGSGSSAISDLVAEYSNVKDLSNFEFSILHDVDGVRDLEYNLVENHNRNNSGHALKRFKRLADFNSGNLLSKRYSNFVDKKTYKAIVNDYYEELLDSKHTGWWFSDLYDKGSRKYYLYQLINHVYKKIGFLNDKHILPKENILLSHPSEEKFLNATRKFVSKLLQALNSEDLEYIEIDQLYPCSNIENYLRYVDEESYIILVDRDPRDIYLVNKYCWHEEICPTNGADFCKWYRYVHESGNRKLQENSHMIKVQFEDIVYKYEDVCKKIEQTTGLLPENHVLKFEKMNPKRSVVNTRIWERYDDPDIQLIERELSEFLYDYTNIDLNDVCGIEPMAKTLF